MKKLVSTLLASTMILSSMTMALAESPTVNGAEQYTQTLAASESDFTVASGVITKYKGNGGEVVIPATINGQAITSIGKEAFKGSAVTAVTVPAGVTTLDYGAFQDCSKLTSVTLPDSLLSLGYGCFMSCTSLTTITLPESLNAIGNYAFSASNNLKTVHLGSSITALGEGVFYNCSALQSMDIPLSCTTIGKDTFRSCTSLHTVTLPRTLTYIGESAFRSCSSLKSVVIPNAVTTMAGYAFAYCSSLESVILSQGLTSIETDMFSGCSSLKTMSITSNITSIGKSAFQDCTGLEQIYVPTTVEKIGMYVFSSYSTSTKLYTYLDVHIYGGAGSYTEKWCDNESKTDLHFEAVTAMPTWANNGIDDPKIPDWATLFTDYVISNKVMPYIDPYNMDSASSRGLIAQSLYNLAGKEEKPVPTHSFKDVGEYTHAISWCYENGIMSGESNTSFGTESNVTREQFALILRQLASLQKKDVDADTSSLSGFSDRSAINSWAEPGVAWAVQAGLMEGNNGKLDPQGSVTQVQVAVMLYKFSLM